MKRIIIIPIILMSVIAIAQNKQSFLTQGNKLYSSGKYAEAEIEYKKSLAKDTDYFNANFNLADAIYKQERYTESSKIFERLQHNAPTKEDQANVYHNLGNSLLKENKNKQAIEAYKNSLRIRPNDDSTRYNLAYAQNQMKKKDQDKKDQDKKDQDKKEQDKKEQNKKDQNKKNQDKMSDEAIRKMLDAIRKNEEKVQKKMIKREMEKRTTKIKNKEKDW